MARFLRWLALVVVVGTSTLVAGVDHAAADASALLPCAIKGSIPASDEGSSAAVALPFALNYYGGHYTSVFVNNNGNVTFTSASSNFRLFELDAVIPPMIAPFDADVDTRGAGSGLTRYGTTTFGGRNAFCVNWGDPAGNGVGYYKQHSDKLNKFQLLLVDRSDRQAGDFDTIFNYASVQWETGDQNGGTAGLGGNSAGAGFSAGDGNPAHFYQLIGSGQPGAFLDSAGGAIPPLARRHGLAITAFNSTVQGRWAFTMHNGEPVRPVASIGGASFFEGDTGTRNIDFAVTLDAPSAAPASVNYSVIRGPHDTATPDVDFVEVKDGTLSLTPDQRYAGLTQTTKFITVQIAGDTTPEPDETFTVQLLSAQGAILGSRTISRSTIFNDDPGAGLRVSVDNTGIIEGNAVATVGGTNKLGFEVTLSSPVPAGHQITVTYDVVGVTATPAPAPGADFVPRSSSKLVFLAGEQEKEVLVGVYADRTREPDETLSMRLLNVAGGATLLNNVGTGTIRNDD